MLKYLLAILCIASGSVLAQNFRNRQRPLSPRTLFDEIDIPTFSDEPSNRPKSSQDETLQFESENEPLDIGTMSNKKTRFPTNQVGSKDRLAARERDEQVKKPVVQTIRRYSVENQDGTFTFGYENADGTYKEETRGTDCVVRGKYGYVDPDGVKREFSYETGNPCVPGQENDDEEESPEFRPANPQRRPAAIKTAPRPSPSVSKLGDSQTLLARQRPVTATTARSLIFEDDDEIPAFQVRPVAPNRPRPAAPVSAFEDGNSETQPEDVLSMKTQKALSALRSRQQPEPADKQQQVVVVRLNEPVPEAPSRPVNQARSAINLDDEFERLSAPRPPTNPAPTPVDFDGELNRLSGNNVRGQRRRPNRPVQRSLFTGEEN